MMDMKISPLFLLIAFCAGIRGILSKSADCDTKDRSFTYIDAAVELIRNAKYKATDCGTKHKSLSYLDAAVELINAPKDRYATWRPLDCEELLKLGYNDSKVYTIWPRSRVLGCKSLEVYCDMDTDGGGWTVIQRRGNFSSPKDYFFQDWKAYKIGFGDIEKDFWLGNDNIFALSNQKPYSVRFDLKDVEGNKRYALYDTFWIDDEDHKYMLHISGYSGDAGDSMTGHSNFKFSTKDQKNDVNEASCAQLFKGAWWYNKCHSANLNGLYLRGKHESFADGVTWYAWKGHHESMDTTEIKVRSKDVGNAAEEPNVSTPQ